MIVTQNHTQKHTINHVLQNYRHNSISFRFFNTIHVKQGFEWAMIKLKANK